MTPPLPPAAQACLRAAAALASAWAAQALWAEAALSSSLPGASEEADEERGRRASLALQRSGEAALATGLALTAFQKACWGLRGP